jgi:photosynthetic reaction center cytochrome c subunit
MEVTTVPDRPSSRSTTFAVLAGAMAVIAAVWPAGLLAQPPAAGAPQGPTAGETFKNIQVLKDLPASQLHDVMVFYEATMGGNCQACHVRGANGEMAFEKDDNDHKVAARKMVQMVRAINATHFNGEERVTCATCHQARREPSPVPPLALFFTADQLAAQQARPSGPPPAAPGAAGPPPAARAQGPGPGAGGRPGRPTETVDQILDKYVQALGGRDAIARAATRTRRGTLTNRAGQVSKATVEDGAAGQFRLTLDGPPPSARGTDGTTAWAQNGPRVRDLDGVEAANVMLLADLASPLTIKDRYTALAAQAYTRIAGHDVVVVQGRRPGLGSETLMFDRASGLLVRRMVRLKTPAGDLPVQIDFADYRPVDGLQAAFEVRVADWESVSALTFSEVVLNQPIAASRFARPVAAPGL